MLGSARQFTKILSPITAGNTLVRFNSVAVKPRVGPKWDIVAAVCIERPPYITPQLSELEQKMMGMLEQKELEESMLNDHELRHKRDVERQERKRKGEEVDEGEAVVTALDLEDSWKKAAEAFEPANIVRKE